MGTFTKPLVNGLDERDLGRATRDRLALAVDFKAY